MAERGLDDAERRQWLKLLRSENVGPATFDRLIARFGTARDALDALPTLAGKGGLGRPLRIASDDDVDAEWIAGTDAVARLVARRDPEYPPLLTGIHSAPPLIWVRGKTDCLGRPAVAIVGSRNASANGRQIARRLARELAEEGFVIVSGFARGIDTAAHEATVDRGTIAVFAGGIGHIYPPENSDLAETVVRNGAILSERPPYASPRGQDFPSRNRIISGIAWGTIVVEAASRSGTLITARYALEQGREVFAVPGTPADPRAAGTNKLLKSGATLVTEADDVISVLAPMMASAPGLREPSEPHASSPAAPPDADEAPQGLGDILADLLGPSGTTVDTLIRESGADAGQVQAALLELELAGRLERDEHGSIRRKTGIG